MNPITLTSFALAIGMGLFCWYGCGREMRRFTTYWWQAKWFALCFFFVAYCAFTALQKDGQP